MDRRPVTTRYVVTASCLWMALVLATFTVPSCTTTGQAQRMAEDVQAADAAKEEADSVVGVLRAEIAGLKSDLEALGERDPETGELIVADQATADAALDLAAIIDSKTAEATKWLDRLGAAEAAARQARAEMAEAEDGFDVATSLLTLAAGFFPPAAIGIPMVQRSKRAFEGVVAAVAAGGGPKNSEATRQAMAAVPGLKDRVTRTRVKIGDKRMEAVPSRNNFS